jgi:hypothetical protein
VKAKVKAKRAKPRKRAKVAPKQAAPQQVAPTQAIAPPVPVRVSLPERPGIPLPPLLGPEAKEFGWALVSLLRDDPRGFSRAAVGVLKQIFLSGGEALFSALQGLAALRKASAIDPPARKLTEWEIESLKSVHGEAIDYSKIEVCIVPHGLLGNERPIAVGNAVYLPEWMNVDQSAEALAREAKMIRDFQSGGPQAVGEGLKAALGE